MNDKLNGYKTIVADPPWQPEMAKINSPASGEGAEKGSPQRHYKTMPIDDIKNLVPPSAKQSHLWLWCVGAHIDWGYEVARSWGFNPLKTLAWCKPGLGVGRFQCNTEFVLICRKGSRHGNAFGRTCGTFFNWERGKHSQKPEDFYSLVKRVSPGPYLEMFSRKVRPGWDVFGDDSSVIKDSIQIAPEKEGDLDE